MHEEIEEAIRIIRAIFFVLLPTTNAHRYSGRCGPLTLVGEWVTRVLTARDAAKVAPGDRQDVDSTQRPG